MSPHSNLKFVTLEILNTNAQKIGSCVEGDTIRTFIYMHYTGLSYKSLIAYRLPVYTCTSKITSMAVYFKKQEQIFHKVYLIVVL